MRDRFRLACLPISIALVGIFSGKQPERIGRELFQILLWLACAVLVVQTLRLTADLFASERRNQTLGLLFLAGLSSGEILASKLCGGVLVALSSVLGFLPAFAISFFAGGVSFSTFVAGAVCLLNLLFFVLAVSVLGSVLREDQSGARAVALLVGASISVLPLAVSSIAEVVAGPTAAPAAFRALSPAHGPALVWASLTGQVTLEFWINAAIVLIWWSALLALSGLILGWTWQKRVSQLIRASRHPFEKWFYRSSAGSAGFQSVLESQPAAWLALRDRRPVTAAWMIVFTGVFGFTMVSSVWRPGERITQFLFVVVAVHALVIFIAIAAAGHGFGRLHSQGMLELLLISPLTVEEIIESQRQAVFVQFRALLRSLLVTEFLLFAAGFGQRSWDFPSLTSYALLWPALAIWLWLVLDNGIINALWLAIHNEWSGYAFLRALGFSAILGPVCLVLLYLWAPAVFGASSFFRQSIVESLLLIILLLLPILWLAFDQRAAVRLARMKQNLRILAQRTVF